MLALNLSTPMIWVAQAHTIERKIDVKSAAQSWPLVSLLDDEFKSAKPLANKRRKSALPVGAEILY